MSDLSFTQEITELHADICSALADTTRILIIYTLAEQPRSVNGIATALGISQPAASRNLKMLRERGLVKAVRQGSSIEYSLTDPRLIQALDLLRQVLRDRLTYRVSLIETEVS